MSFIRQIRYFHSSKPDARPLLLLCGYKGRIWQTKRLIGVLVKHGYSVTAMDFNNDVLRSGDATQLPQLVAEVRYHAEQLRADEDQPVMLVGISLGALIALNIVRSSESFDRAVLLTGGDIARIAQRLYPERWPMPYRVLASEWKRINMYSTPAKLRGKKLLFVHHAGERLIVADDIIDEVKRQQAAGNMLELITRDRFDHVGTIFEETVLYPERTLEYIRRVS